MNIKVWSMTSGGSSTITVSKLTSVKELKRRVEDKFEVEPERQSLFFQGKTMEDDYTMDDYSVRANSKIQLMVRKPIGSLDHLTKKGESKSNEKTAGKERGRSGSRERKTGNQVEGGTGGAGGSPHLADGGGPVVSSSRPNGRARPKTKQTESGSRKSGEQEQEARSKRR